MALRINRSLHRGAFADIEVQGLLIGSREIGVFVGKASHAGSSAGQGDVADSLEGLQALIPSVGFVRVGRRQAGLKEICRDEFVTFGDRFVAVRAGGRTQVALRSVGRYIDGDDLALN